jgi:hypothetical protein
VSIGKRHFRSTEDDNGFSEEIVPMDVIDGKRDLIRLVRENLARRGGSHKMAGLAGPGESGGVLEERGLADDTRVRYTSDHGDNVGARGLWGKSNMYEAVAGVPMDPGGRRHPDRPGEPRSGHPCRRLPDRAGGDRHAGGRGGEWLSRTLAVRAHRLRPAGIGPPSRNTTASARRPVPSSCGWGGSNMSIAPPAAPVRP